MTPTLLLAQSTAPETTRLSFLTLLSRGGWFMLPILLFSLLALTLIIERLILLRRAAVIPKSAATDLKKILSNPHNPNRRNAALTYCDQHPSTLTRITAAALRQLPQGRDAADRALADTGSNEIAKLRKNLRTLHGIAAVSPTLGLLGTVYGMIDAFETASRIGLGHSEALTRGIYEALVTTMAGLIVAIPTLMFYYYFAGKIDTLTIDLNDTLADLLNTSSAARQPTEDPTPATTSLERF